MRLPFLSQHPDVCERANLGCGYYVTYVLRITHAAAPVAMLVIFHVGTWTNYQCVGCCLLPNVHMSRVIHIFTTSFQRRTGNVKISFLLQSDLYGKLVELGTLFRIWVQAAWFEITYKNFKMFHQPNFVLNANFDKTALTNIVLFKSNLWLKKSLANEPFLKMTAET